MDMGDGCIYPPCLPAPRVSMLLVINNCIRPGVPVPASGEMRKFYEYISAALIFGRYFLWYQHELGKVNLLELCKELSVRSIRHEADQITECEG